jgi:hypothetical protein
VEGDGFSDTGGVLSSCFWQPAMERTISNRNSPSNTTFPLFIIFVLFVDLISSNKTDYKYLSLPIEGERSGKFRLYGGIEHNPYK